MEGEEAELELLLSLDGASRQAAVGHVVEFMVKQTSRSRSRPHGLRYSLVFRPAKGSRTCVSTIPMRSRGREDDSWKPLQLTITGTVTNMIPAGHISSRPRSGSSRTFGAK